MRFHGNTNLLVETYLKYQTVLKYLGCRVEQILNNCESDSADSDMTCDKDFTQAYLYLDSISKIEYRVAKYNDSIKCYIVSGKSSQNFAKFKLQQLGFQETGDGYGEISP